MSQAYCALHLVEGSSTIVSTDGGSVFPSPGSPGSEVYPDPQLWSALQALQPNMLLPPGWWCPDSRQSHQSGSGRAAWTRKQTYQPPAAFGIYRTAAGICFSEPPPVWGTPHVYMSFIPCWVKINKQVNKSCKQESVLCSQPSILHFSKQLFHFIGSFYFSL